MQYWLLASKIYAQKFPEWLHLDCNFSKNYNSDLTALQMPIMRRGQEKLKQYCLSSNGKIWNEYQRHKKGVGNFKVFCSNHFMFNSINGRKFRKENIIWQWAQNKFAEKADFFKFVLFTFHRSGFVNRHNFWLLWHKKSICRSCN